MLAFGVAAMAAGLGLVLIMIGVALGFVAKDPAEADRNTTQADPS